MSLANPVLQPAKLIDEDYEIRSHGAGAKDLKLAGMSLIEQFDYLISLSHEQVESSKEEDKEEEDKEEEDKEEEEEEEEEEQEEEEEEFDVCEVCFKDKAHDTFDCPYLDCIPNPEEATVGDGYAIVCRECHVLGGHPDRGWVGRAIMKSCSICESPGVHWDSECPDNADPEVYDVESQTKVLMHEVYGGI
ncbi:hypothetical protein M0R45_033289 [Rubus argutus]|uniref:Transcription factor interactor and regulator CCHC(Zn) family n=1 Tax=Rubus argutus TaxID=59490 RepID=A0AAW1WLC2_RUBAR